MINVSSIRLHTIMYLYSFHSMRPVKDTNVERKTIEQSHCFYCHFNFLATDIKDGVFNYFVSMCYDSTIWTDKKCKQFNVSSITIILISLLLFFYVKFDCTLQIINEIVKTGLSKAKLDNSSMKKQILTYHKTKQNRWTILFPREKKPTV